VIDATTPAMMSAETREPTGWLRLMALIRAFDSKLPDLYTRGLVRGSSHAAIGQEAAAVGACATLRPSDYITSTHRGHGHAIAKGADVRLMMAELLGRETGYCHGRGGSMHIADFSLNMLGANGIVGGGFGLAAGAALTAQQRAAGQVALCFFGDGAINQGSFHGVANLAAIWSLPLILLCENNRFAMSARVEEMTSVPDLAIRATAYGFPGVSVDGTDVTAVHAATEEAVSRARAGNGPSLVVANCYRFAGHFSGDTMKYRTKAEAEPWLDRDPLKLHRDDLIAAGRLSEHEATTIIAEAEALVAEALAWAETQPFPSIDEVGAHLYA
jgi:acetoin:2,6-dichlorophenolindophenol oxidoreductase subunit alpha